LPRGLESSRHVRSSIAYVRAREWWLACNGMLDPCPGSDNIPCSPFHSWHKCMFALAASVFLCCIPAVKALFRIEMTPFHQVLPHSCGGARWNPKCGRRVSSFPCISDGRLAHVSIARSLGCGVSCGYVALCLYLPHNKRSTLHANDRRCRFDWVLAARIMRQRRR
jgi:hypothetical protein